MIFHGIAWYGKVLHGFAWYCMELHGIAPSCPILRHLAPSCAILRHLAPSCAILHHLAPSCTILHQVAPCCTMVHHITPEYARVCQSHAKVMPKSFQTIPKDSKRTHICNCRVAFATENIHLTYLISNKVAGSPVHCSGSAVLAFHY